MHRSHTDLSRLPPKSDLYYEFRSTTSMPIEIPTGRRPVYSPNGSPLRCSTSPDLIFEMSPIASGLSSPLPHNFGLVNASPDPDVSMHEPFTYSFPKLSVLQKCTNSGNRSQLRQTSALSINGSPLAPVIPSATAKQSPLSVIPDECGASALPYTCSSTTVTNGGSTTKITGFTPVTPTSATPPNSPVRCKKTTRLSPPPRSSSYSSSPWILPGKIEAQDCESGSFETDLGSFEFKRHLMRRIENQNQFRRISLLSSMRI